MSQDIFHRAELLLGKDKIQYIGSRKAILFGIGGVGSWCAESLIRTGITNLTIVDSDRICITNVNRQMMATSKTIGQIKTEALKSRLLEINPEAQITTHQKIYNKDTSSDFKLKEYDIIIDAIDSLDSKVHLIQSATATNALFVSSMGAALKIDPTCVRVNNFWKVQGCSLARRVRKMIRKHGQPTRDFLCVYSDEVIDNIGIHILENNNTNTPSPQSADTPPGNSELANHHWDDHKAAINGSLAHITAIFGFTLAGLVIKELSK